MKTFEGMTFSTRGTAMTAAAETGVTRFPALRMALSALIYALELIAIAIGYLGLADVAQLLPGINPTGTPLWPPSGFALALILLRGYRVWPALLIGTLSADAIFARALTAEAPAAAIGATLGAMVGAWLIKNWSNGIKTFATPGDIAKFVLIAFVPTAMITSIGAMIGPLSSGDANYSALAATWAVWWLADAAGILIIVPFIVLWATTSTSRFAESKLPETIAIIAAASVIGVIAFVPMTAAFDSPLGPKSLYAFLILLPLMWAGLRGNQLAASAAALIFCGAAGWSLSAAAGRISPLDLKGPLALLALSISTPVASLVLSAIIAGYREKQALLLSEQSNLNFRLVQALEAFKNAEQHFHIFVEGVTDYAIFLLDTSGRVANWNSTAEKIIGYTAEEIVGKPFSMLYRPDERRGGLPKQALKLAVQNGRHETEGWRTRKDGTPIFVTGTLTAIRNDNADLVGFASIIRDATERRDTQEKLVEAREQLAIAQKMEAIGKLTGGIAHDFNNLLMIIGGNAEMFKRLLDPKLPRAIEAIQTAAKRGESLTRQLLTFSRRQHLSPTVVDLNASIRNMRTMIESSLRGNIVYKEDISPSLWPVKVDLAELELAIVNIAVNARDAMPNGGVFMMTADNVKVNEEADDDPQSGDFVALEFKDTGMGIPPDILSKIFDPYFTTKEVGKGTGLGLSQVHGFAHQAGGTVHAESKIERGTAFTIYLPAYVGREIVKEKVSDVDVARSQRPMVLVVDDSAEVAEVTSSLFEHLGYNTIYRESADAALKLLADGEKIDLIFSDIVMPGTIDGVGLASEVQSQYPHLPVILTTGYSDAAQGAPSNLRILRKPFDADALRSFMQDMMGPASQ
jgi:PAS domain S-box-containing protein